MLELDSLPNLHQTWLNGSALVEIEERNWLTRQLFYCFLNSNESALTIASITITEITIWEIGPSFWTHVVSWWPKCQLCNRYWKLKDDLLLNSKPLNWGLTLGGIHWSIGTKLPHHCARVCCLSVGGDDLLAEAVLFNNDGKWTCWACIVGNFLGVLRWKMYRLYRELWIGPAVGLVDGWCNDLLFIIDGWYGPCQRLCFYYYIIYWHQLTVGVRTQEFPQSC
jgi:hypothetical protein